MSHVLYLLRCIKISFATGNYQGRLQPEGTISFKDDFIYRDLGARKHFTIRIVPYDYSQSGIEGN